MLDITETLRLHTLWTIGKPGGQRADLREADLYRANLYGADLRGADLYRANLYGANLREANLYGANLRGANLRGADLHGASLHGANLYGAKVAFAQWPSPTTVLGASWGRLSDGLTVALMRYDAACHPDPSAFDRWAAGGPCPYDGGVMVERAALFSERRDLWSPGPCPRPYDLMVRVLSERCDTNWFDGAAWAAGRMAAVRS